jgi:hypothetical protein
LENQTLPKDFKEFLKLLNVHDIDVWVAISQENGDKLKKAFIDFGMISDVITADLFQEPGNIVRMGLPPMRIEVLNKIDGVDFITCYKNRKNVVIDDIPIRLISLNDLRINKKKSGRYKDLDDLENLPES